MIGTRQGGVFISPVSLAWRIRWDKRSWDRIGFDILCRLNFEHNSIASPEHNASIIVPFLVEEGFLFLA